MLITHSIKIDTTVERLWATTIDVERWPDLTPTITRIERLDREPLAVGSKARIKQPGLPDRVWTVTRVDDSTHFEWRTQFGLLRMSGQHHIERAAPSGVINRLTIELTGPGSGLAGRLVRPRLLATLRSENEAFKRACETPATAGVQSR